MLFYLGLCEPCSKAPFAILVMAKTAQNAIKNTSWRVPSVLRASHKPQVLELNNKKKINIEVLIRKNKFLKS